MTASIEIIDFLKGEIQFFEKNKMLIPNSDNDFEKFFFGLIKRIDCLCNLLVIATKDNYKDFEELEFSLGLTFRAIVLDNLMALNLIQVCFDKQKTEREKLDFLQDILHDGIKKTAGNIDLFQSLKFLSNNKSKELIDEITAAFPRYFNNESKSRKGLTVANLFENLAKDEEWKITSPEAYAVYLHYSKYEHFSELSLFKSNADLRKRKEVLELSIERILFRHFRNCISFLAANNQIFQSAFNKSSELAKRLKLFPQ